MPERPSYDYVQGLYHDLLGRDPSDDEVRGHLDNPGGEQGLYDFFIHSPEYSALHGGDPTWHDSGGHVTYDNPTDNPNYQPPPPVLGGGDYGPQGGGGSAPVGGGGNVFGSNPAGAFAPTTADWTRLHGFNSENYYNPDQGSVKYQFARIAADYPNTPEGLQRLVQDPRFRAAFPNARQVAPDKIDFGGALSDGSRGTPVGVIDVGEGFDTRNNTGTGWWWGWDQGGAPLPTGTTTGAGAGSRAGNNAASFANLGAAYGGPGGAGITNGPLQQTGQDPLSQLITGGLADFILNNGATPFGQQIQDELMGVIQGGAGTSRNKRFESARELIDKGRRTMINDARGDLANRGLLSEPGIPQGAETGAIRRITENIAPEFSRALRDISADEDAQVMQALSLATGMAGDQAKTFLAGIGEGTARQTALAQLALQTLAQNQSWSQFLAQFGLQRDTTLAMLQSGRIDDVLALLNNFISLSGLSNAGHI